MSDVKKVFCSQNNEILTLHTYLFGKILKSLLLRSYEASSLAYFFQTKLPRAGSRGRAGGVVGGGVRRLVSIFEW